MQNHSALFIAVISLLLSGLNTAAAAGKVWYRSNFTQNAPEWSGYNEAYPVKIIPDTDPATGMPLLRFTPQGGEWNLQILTLPEGVTISETTMIRFRIKTPIPFLHQMELNNAAENATYQFPFLINANNEWVTVQKYLYPATFLRSETPGMPHDGLLRDPVSRFALMLWGSPIELAEVEIFESDGTLPELPEDGEQQQIDSYLATRQPHHYPMLQRNGIFPFGAVVRMDAMTWAAEQLKHPAERSLSDALADMKRHGMNTYVNFCETTPAKLRLTATDYASMYLLDTRYSNTRLGDLTENDPGWEDFDQLKNHPFLLAWYGPDEPLPGSYANYVNSKAAVEKRDPNHPFVSAFNTPLTREKLGPAMEIIMPDIYSLRPKTKNSAEVLLTHFASVREARNQSAGKRVWFVTQTFSNRSATGERLWRYPTPEEIRLDMYTLVAGGASGILFFIYNDLPTYLDGTVRGEEFDATLVDPWGSGNAVYDEIADFGRRAVPVMPSFLDAEPSATIAVRSDDRLLVGQSANALGTLLVAVNQSLTEAYRGFLECQVSEGMQMYDLITLLPTDGTLALRPGEGSLLTVTTPEHFAQLKSEIAARRELQAQELAELRRRELAVAGFSGEATPAWLAAEQALAELQAGFSALHRQLSAPEVIVRVDGGAEFAPLHERLKELSRRYFAMRTAWAAGSVPSEDELELLRQQQKTLTEDYRQRLSSPAAENP